MAMAGKDSSGKTSGRYLNRQTRIQTLHTHRNHDPYQHFDIADLVDFSKID